MNKMKLKMIATAIITCAFAFNANLVQSAEQPKVEEELVETDEKLGKDQEEKYDHKLFLRLSRVLPKAWQSSISVNLNYQNAKRGITNRTAGLTLTLSTSFIQNTDISVSVPFAYNQKTQDDYFEGKSETTGKAGIGDIDVSFKFLIVEEKKGWPELVGSLSIGVPTGESQYVDPFSAGTGHYSLGGGLLFSKTVYPATLFGRLEYTNSFAETVDESKIQPGPSFDYGFGFGFALNHQLTLRSEFSGSYQSELKVDGEDISFSYSEPMRIRNALSYSIDPVTSIDPSITFGLNDDATDIVLGASFSKGF